MANREVRTDVVVKGRVEGLNQVSDQIERLNKAASSAQASLTKGFAAAQQATTQFARSMTQLSSQMPSGRPGGGPTPQFADPGRPPPRPPAGGGGGGGRKEGDGLQIDFSPLLQPLHELKSAIQELAGAVHTDQRGKEKDKQEEKKDQAKEEKTRGSFMQGFLQSALPTAASIFLQRGPGMMRQAAGQMVGQTLSGVAGGMGTMMNAGLPGIQQAIGAVPLPGMGVAAGLLGTAGQYGQMAIERHRARLEYLPMLMGGGAMGAARQTSATAAAVEGRRMPGMGGLGVGIEQGRVMEEMEIRVGAEDRVRKRKGLDPISQAQAVVQETMKEANKLAASRRPGDAALRRAGQAKAETSINIGQAALQYGAMSETEALPLVGGTLAAGGGGLREMRRQKMLEATFVGKRTFGLDEGTMGAFLQAGRRGGLAGTEAGTAGAGGEAMAKQIATGTKLGLQGSELTNYMRTVAEGISQWQQTGIPFPDDAFAGIADELTKSGLAGPRGLAVTQGVIGAAQGISQRGPQNAAELMMLQTMGGFQGGGAEEFERSQIQMEKGGGAGAGANYQQLVKRFMKAGGGGATGRLLTRQMLSGMGIKMGAEEMSLVGRQAEGETLTKKEQTRLAQIQKEKEETKGPMGRVPKNLDDMLSMGKEAMDKWGGVVKAQAALQQKQTDAGEQMIEPLLKLQEGTTDLAKGFANLASGPLLTVTQKFADLAKSVSEKGVMGTLTGAGPLEQMLERLKESDPALAAKLQAGIDG